MNLFLKDTRKEGSVVVMCYFTAGYGGGEDRTPRERMGVVAIERGTWAASLTLQ